MIAYCEQEGVQQHFSLVEAGANRWYKRMQNMQSSVENKISPMLKKKMKIRKKEIVSRFAYA